MMYHSQKIKRNNIQHLATSILHSPKEVLVPSTKTIPLCVCMCVCVCVRACVRECVREHMRVWYAHAHPPPCLSMRVCVHVWSVIHILKLSGSCSISIIFLSWCFHNMWHICYTLYVVSSLYVVSTPVCSHTVSFSLYVVNLSHQSLYGVHAFHVWMSAC